MPGSDLDEPRHFRLDRHGTGADHGHTAQDRHHAQGGDQRVDTGTCHQQAVRQSHEGPQQERRTQGEQNAATGVEHGHRQDADDGLRRADAEVDLPLQDDDDHADSGDGHQ